MNIKLIDQNRLKICLKTEEVGQMRLDIANLKIDDTATKAAMVRLLGQAKSATGFSSSLEELFIEVYPHPEGCDLYFTSFTPGRPQAPRAQVFEFDTLAHCTQACMQLFCRFSHRIVKSGLYSQEGRYRLCLHPLCGDDPVFSPLLGEYGRWVGTGDISLAMTQEHWRCIEAEDALEKIVYYLG